MGGQTGRQKEEGKNRVYFPNIDGTFLPDSMKTKEESDFIDQDIFKFRKLIFKVKKKKEQLHSNDRRGSNVHFA